MRDELEAGAGMMPAMNGCGEGGHPGCDHEVVTRISLGSVLFFGFLGVVMINTRSINSFRQGLYNTPLYGST